MTNDKNKAPVYKLIINDNENQTYIDVLSLIEDDPAILIDWVALKNEVMPVKLAIQSEEKQRIMTPVLLPNQYILRFDKTGKLTGQINGEYYITIDALSIELAVQRFFKKYYNKTVNFNLNHNADDVLNNDQVYIYESWLTSKNDKSKDFGFNVPEGSWMVTLQIDDNELWDRIKSGELTAISMEGMFNYGAVVDEVTKQYNSAELKPDEILLDKLKELLSK